MDIVIDAIEELLEKHQPHPGSTRCSCGWIDRDVLPLVSEQRKAHRRHQAEIVGAIIMGASRGA